MWFDPNNIDLYEKLTENHEGRDHLIQRFIWDMLENFSAHEKAPQLLWKIIREADELPLKDLNKLYELSLDNQIYGELYNFYMDLHNGKWTAHEHIQRLGMNSLGTHKMFEGLPEE